MRNGMSNLPWLSALVHGLPGGQHTGPRQCCDGFPLEPPRRWGAGAAAARNLAWGQQNTTVLVPNAVVQVQCSPHTQGVPQPPLLVSVICRLTATDELTVAMPARLDSGPQP